MDKGVELKQENYEVGSLCITQTSYKLIMKADARIS